MQTRRAFLTAALGPALLATAARADFRCIADPKHGGQMCKTSINFTDAYQETYHARHEPAAIWIACVAVVFAAYGHVVQQLRIAEEAYGDFSKIDLGSVDSAAKPLLRAWKDDDGVAFRVSATSLYDSQAAGAKLDQDALVAAVQRGDPVILVGSGHPVVLTALAYMQRKESRPLVAGFVFDPMPMVGPRALDLDEVIPKEAGGELHYAIGLKLEKI